MSEPRTYAVFVGHRRVGHGELATVLRRAYAWQQQGKKQGEEGTLLFFEDFRRQPAIFGFGDGVAGMGEGAQGEKMVAAQLGRVVRTLALGGQVGSLVLTGGDSAAAVCSALAATALWLRGEVQPGIAWGMLLDGALPGLPVVTKAGGFGSDDALEVALRHLHLQLFS